MTSIRFIIIAAFTLVMASCGSETLQEQLEGTWNATQIQYTNCDSPNENETFALSTDPCTRQSTTNCASITMQFSSGGSVSISSTEKFQDDFDESTDSGTYTVSEDGAFVLCIDQDCQEGTLEIDGDTAVINVRDDDEGCNVIINLIR